MNPLHCLSAQRLSSLTAGKTASRFGWTLLFFTICSCLSARAADGPKSTTPLGCTATYLEFDAKTDVHAQEEYQQAIASLLKQHKFAELDCLADAARSQKDRFAGGSWKLHKIYSGLDEPQPGHATEEDWREHLNRLSQWIEANPDSITARVALAKSYVGYAWNARGDGYSDTVSESGWKLFAERLNQARKVLEKSSTLRVKCPEWFVAMQQVALGQQSDPEQETALYERAIAFEPGYDLYYRMHATYLLPKWNGEDGDAARFAERVSNGLGGPAGDILYFQIGAEIVCPCTDPEFGRMSWARLQKGFEAVRAKYGDSLVNWNVFALMAVKNNDEVAADAAFKQVGDNWDKETWRTESWFRQNRDFASEMAPKQARTRVMQQEALANIATAAGAAYKKDFDRIFATFEQSCLQKAAGNQVKFRFLVNVGKEGSADNAYFDTPTPVSLCLMSVLSSSHARNEKPFPIPPHDTYWIPTDVDPSVLNASK